MCYKIQEILHKQGGYRLIYILTRENSGDESKNESRYTNNNKNPLRITYTDTTAVE